MIIKKILIISSKKFPKKTNQNRFYSKDKSVLSQIKKSDMII